jgi:hypothetical protein
MMANIFSKQSSKAKEKFSKLKAKLKKNPLAYLLFMELMLLPTLVLADDSGTGIFCYVSTYLKGIVGSAAAVAIGFWGIEHIFGAAKLHDMVMRVGVGCGVVMVGALMIAKSGLTSNCT